MADCIFSCQHVNKNRIAVRYTSPIGDNCIYARREKSTTGAYVIPFLLPPAVFFVLVFENKTEPSFKHPESATSLPNSPCTPDGSQTYTGPRESQSGAQRPCADRGSECEDSDV